MKKYALIAVLVLAGCGGWSSPATFDEILPVTTTTPAVEVTTKTAAVEATTSTTATRGEDIELRARCGAVELPVADKPVLPSEPLDATARAALEQATVAAGLEAGIFETFEWAVAERSENRIVLFGRAPASDSSEPSYANAVLELSGDTWDPTSWGGCHIEVEADGYGNAAWILDAAPTSASTTLDVLINERECASGQPPVGRDIIPVVTDDDDRVTITVLVEPVQGFADCPSNPWYATTIDLGAALGDRGLFDGSTIPALPRPWPPTQTSIDSFGADS